MTQPPNCLPELTVPSIPVVFAIPVVGPAGAPGSATLQVIGTAVAATALSGHRAVTVSGGQFVYATNTDSTMLALPIWITTGAAAEGDSVTAVAYGPITEPTWSWTVGAPIYLGANGVLTQTAPVSPAAAFLAQLGVATSATQMFVQRYPSIRLA